MLQPKKTWITCAAILLAVLCAAQYALAAATQGASDKEEEVNLLDIAPSGQTRTISPEGKVQVDENAAPTQLLKIQIHVPHNLHAQNYFSAFPYMPKPPVIKKLPGDLPTRDKQLKQQLLGSGYVQRLESNPDRFYPAGGWRWQNAYHAALRKKGGGEPHTMIELYPWIHQMLLFIKPEIERINAIEKERRLRYRIACQEYGETGAEKETEATKQGLYARPIQLARHMHGTVLDGYAKLPPGEWWITGTHKLVGLTYYWEQPVRIEAGQDLTVELNEDNALIIEGSW